MSNDWIIAAAITWAWALVAMLALGRARRARLALLSGERCGVVKPAFFVNSPSTECVLRPQHSGSHKDEHGTRWRFVPMAAKVGEVCGAYRLPTTAADSGLCARCGMYDYKHQEQPNA